jgi:hypothetical protein
VLLGGAVVDDELVRRLAPVLDTGLRRKLTEALAFRSQIVALTWDQKADVLEALERSSGELGELRDRLVADEHWRRRSRL